jgi:hypothetical protein
VADLTAEEVAKMIAYGTAHGLPDDQLNPASYDFCDECPVMAETIQPLAEAYARSQVRAALEQAAKALDHHYRSFKCPDPAHDDRWCAYCDAKLAGIEDCESIINDQLQALEKELSE